MSGHMRFPGKLARALVTWAERYADPAEREWIGAMRAELDAVDGGAAQLRWAAGALPLLWRPYRSDILLFVLCTAAVVLVNYLYPKFASARPIELFFFGQQFYLPLLGLLAARSAHGVLVGGNRHRRIAARIRCPARARLWSHRRVDAVGHRKS